MFIQTETIWMEDITIHCSTLNRDWFHPNPFHLDKGGQDCVLRNESYPHLSKHIRFGYSEELLIIKKRIMTEFIQVHFIWMILGKMLICPNSLFTIKYVGFILDGMEKLK